MRVRLDRDDGVSWTADAVTATDRNGDPCVDLSNVTGLDPNGNAAPLTPEALADLAFHAAQKLGLPIRS